MKIPVLNRIEKYVRKLRDRIYIYIRYNGIDRSNKIILMKDEKEIVIKKLKDIPNVDFNITGYNNIVKIHEPIKKGIWGDKREKLKINIFSSGCEIEINRNCTFSGTEINVWYPNQKLIIGKNSSFGSTRFDMVSEDRIIEIGEDCMFADEIYIRNGDGHTILDKESQEIINLPQKTLKIGNHVWIGKKTIIAKNVVLPNNCMVGMGSIVTKHFEEEYCVIAGNPARIVKSGVIWNISHPGNPLIYSTDEE